MAEIIVSHGLCSAIRPKVMTALKPYGFTDDMVETWATGHYRLPIPPSARVPDSWKWARMHYARITVSDARAAWAERLLWKSGRVWLETPPLNPGLDWSMPPDCKESENSQRNRGQRYIPWSEQKGKQKPAKMQAKLKKAAKPAQRKQTRQSSIRDFFNRL